MRKRLTIYLALIIGFSSCMKDQYKFDEGINTDAFQPNVALPLLNTEIAFEKFLGGIDTLEFVEKDSNELIHIIIEDSLFSYDAAEVLTTENRSIENNFKLSPISLDSMHGSTSIELRVLVDTLEEPQKSIMQAADGNRGIFPATDTLAFDPTVIKAGDEFSTVKLSQGVMRLSITNNWPTELQDVRIELKNANTNTPIDTFIYDQIAANTSASRSSDLTGKNLENNISLQVISVNSLGSGTDSVDIDLSDLLILEFIIDSLNVVQGNAIIPSQEIYQDTLQIPFVLGEGNIIHTLLFSQGNFNYTFQHSIQEVASLRLRIPGLHNDGVIFDQLIQLDPNGGVNTTTASIDITGYTLDLTDGDTNTLNIEITANILSSGNIVSFDTSQFVNANVNIVNMSILEYNGIFAQQTIDLASDTIDLDFTGDFIDGLNFVAPAVILTFNSSFGMPFSFNLDGIGMVSDGIGNNLSGDITNNPVIINAASVKGEKLATSININANNSNIATLLNSLPNQLIANIGASLNPNGPVDNFVTDSSTIEVTMGIDIPLHVKITDFGFSDTMDIEPDMLSGFKAAEFVGAINNGLPVDLDLQIYMMDSLYNITDSLLSSGGKLANAASVDANGNTAANTISEINEIADSAKLSNFNRAHHLLLDFSLNTPDNGNTSAKLFTTAKIGIQLGINTKLSINLSNND